MHRTSGNMRVAAACVAIFIAASFLGQIEAKRGCSSFGHSCYGGHGKRSDALQTEAFLGRIGQDEIAAPRTIYPQSSNDQDVIIPIRNGGFMENGNDISNDLLKQRLAPYLRHWLIALRKSQEDNEGYQSNNLN